VGEELYSVINFKVWRNTVSGLTPVISSWFSSSVQSILPALKSSKVHVASFSFIDSANLLVISLSCENGAIYNLRGLKSVPRIYSFAVSD
jgi:hypothetical protein